MRTTHKVFLAVGSALCVVGLAACAAEPPQEANRENTSSETEPPSETMGEETEVEEVFQADDCGWDAPRIEGSGEIASEAPTNLSEQLVGAWQHVYFDSGDGLEAPEPDIRYVFPSDGGMRYCQDLPGVTDQAENRAEITIADNLIQPPGGHPGFEVIAINEEAMLWTNNLDGSRYVLERR